MGQNASHIQEELLLLYELSLSVGQSLDPDTTGLAFLRSLMARRNLIGASIWWRFETDESDNAAEWALLAGIPRVQIVRERLPASHALCRLARAGEAMSFTAADAEFEAFDLDPTDRPASWALYPLGGQGMLLMSSASTELFTPRMLGQLRAVIGKLHTALQGGMAHARLRQSEAALRERTRELDESRNLLQAIIDTAPIRVFWKDRQMRYLGCNPLFAKDAGKPDPQALIGKNDFDLAWSEQARRYRDDDRQVIVSGESRLGYEEPQTKSDGHMVWLRTSKVPLKNENDEIIGVLGVYDDITQRKQAKEELQRYRLHLEDLVAQRTHQLAQAKEAAETANVAKSAFLANMSHEIRTPLTAILGMAYLIRRSGLTDQQNDYLAKLEDAGAHLLEIINAILDLSKIESGKFELAQTEIDVEKIIDNVTAILHDSLQAKPIELKVELATMPGPLFGDAARLQQALLNYAANAVKFTEAGLVTLRVIPQTQTEDGVRIRFEVEDTGIGISPDTLGRLFKIFQQADNTHTRKYGGTGLGLAITKKIAELMGGSAGATSTPGEGSLFWFDILLRKAAPVGAEPELGPSIDSYEELSRTCGGRRVLIVEDEPLGREIAQRLLQDIGLDVGTAEDGAAALQLAQANDYDLILMDMQMPVMDGLQATLKIRALPRHADTPIIAVTANAFEEHRRHCVEAGMNDFLTKPLDYDKFYGILLKWLEPVNP